MLQTIDQGNPVFPPTTLYNENWLLRLLLNAYHEHGGTDLFPVLPDCEWFSEGLLPSAFLARFRGDPLAEGWTHADGVLGHIHVGSAARGDVSLQQDAKQLVVVEGKMFSPLSKGTRKAPDYDQAARNVACIAELLHRAGQPPEHFDQLAFLLMAPQEQIEAGIFESLVTRASIEEKVAQRVKAYDGDRDAWHHDWFLPTLERIRLDTVTWEQAIEDLANHAQQDAEGLAAFYQRCVGFGRPITWA